MGICRLFIIMDMPDMVIRPAMAARRLLSSWLMRRCRVRLIRRRRSFDWACSSVRNCWFRFRFDAKTILLTSKLLAHMVEICRSYTYPSRSETSKNYQSSNHSLIAHSQLKILHTRRPLRIPQAVSREPSTPSTPPPPLHLPLITNKSQPLRLCRRQM